VKSEGQNKQAPKAPLTAGEIARTIVEDSPLAIYVFQEGRLAFVNRSFVELSGYSREELSKIDYLTLIHPDFRDEVIRQTEMALAGGISAVPQEPEIRILRKNGETRLVQIRPRIIEYARRPAVLGFATDISDHKHIDQMLQESEARYRMLVDSLSDVVWIFNFTEPKRLVYVSPSVTQLLGYTVEEAMSKSIEDVLTPASLEVAMGVLMRVSPDASRGQLSRHEPLTLELELIRKDGSIMPVEVKYSVVMGSNVEPPRILALARDISERKALEAEHLDIERKGQAASRLAAIGEMAAGIAHEINNPLTSVVGFSELLMSRELPEAIKKDLEIINEGAKRVAAIVRRLSVFARQSKPLRRRTDINKIAENALRLRAYHLQTGGIEVETDFAPDLPEVLADSGQLTEVFLNIVVNAETEMSLAHGQGRLRVSTETVGEWVRISFQDDGPGVSAENMQRLFTPFFTTRPIGMGTGLGLSISYGIITQHGGRIWAESELGRGATFLIELPVIAKHGASEETGQIQKLGRALGARVLVVDDEADVRGFLHRVLTDWGYHVDVAESGPEALERIKDRSYAAILVDIRMPSMSGIELCRTLKETDAKALAKVILITGDVLSPDSATFVSVFKLPLVTKPIDLVDLNRKITAILSLFE
jgi:PAS domain S-box-containing protein